MVKTKTPLFSAEASGTFAKRLTFLQTRRGSTIRTRRRPRDPKTGGQLGRRSAFHFISKNWSTVDATDRATWSAIASQVHLSNYNAFTRYNLEAWHDFLAPSKVYPMTRAGSVGQLTIGPDASALGRTVTFRIYQNPVWSNWGIVYFANLSTGFSTAVDNAVAFQWSRLLGYHYTDWITSTPAAWYFNARSFSIDGTLGPEHGEFVVT